MSERYVKVFSGNENLYTDNAPVVIRASALLKDTETGKMIAQLKFQNVSGKMISYVKVMLTPLDAIKNPLGDSIAFEYLDLAVSDREDFGSKKPLPLPNSATRSFRLGICVVGFADGSVWTSNDTDWQSAAESSAIAKIIAVEDTYQTALALSRSKIIEDIKKAKEIFESIQKEKDVSIELDLCGEKIAEDEERQAKKELQKAEKKLKKKRIKKLGLIGSGIFAVLALVGYFALYPLISYLNGIYGVYINMYGIEEFEIPEGATVVADHAFQGCHNLKNVTIPDSVVSIGDYAFSTSGLESITIPDGVTRIGVYAFWGCINLKNVAIPDGVVSIGNRAFEFCHNLKNVTIPDGVTTLESSVFLDCSSLESITIPASVTRIERWSLAYCPKLTSITYSGTKAQWNAIKIDGIAIDDWDKETDNYTIYCSDGEITKDPNR